MIIIYRRLKEIPLTFILQKRVKFCDEHIESDNGLDQYKLKNMQVLVEVTSDLHLFQTN